MEIEQFQSYQRLMLSQAIAEALKRNEEQTRTWVEYKKRHENIIGGLETFPLELSTNCMVPIGKKALMKGKLIHTNEILVSLGDGYFAKYSAVQAIALCNRRIKRAQKELKKLEEERVLYETRQTLPVDYNVFGDNQTKDLVEHWEEEKLEDWRVKHREREREYHKKLSELRNSEKPTNIETEEDLFKRLDELELEEELADEYHRLDEERNTFYREHLNEGEVYYESDEDEDEDDGSSLDEDDESSPDEATVEELQKELAKFKDLSESKSEKFTSDETKSPKDRQKVEEVVSSEPEPSKADIETAVSKAKKEKRRVSFAEHNFLKYDGDLEYACETPVERMSPIEQTSYFNDDTRRNFESNDEEAVIRINFKHSDKIPQFKKGDPNEIETPSDIYRLVSKPKSILKNSGNDVNPVVIPPPPEHSSDEDVLEDEVFSTYSTIVKDIQEKEPEKNASEVTESVPEKRIVSKFKKERSAVKK